MAIKRIKQTILGILFLLAFVLLSLRSTAVLAATDTAAVFEEPVNYDVNAMSLSASEVGDVEDGGTAENELFDFEAFIKESDIKDGTAPFDADSAAGNDASENNNIVRTFDTITYPVKITINPKKVDKLDNIVLKITGTLDNGISGNQVNAKFSVGGYSDMINKVVGFEQMYTIEQTGTSIMIPINIDVAGAKNGVDLKPHLKVEVVSVDGVDMTQDNVSMAFDDLKSVKTSGLVNIKSYVAGGLAGAGIPYYPYAAVTGNDEDTENTQAFALSFGIQKLDGKTDNRGATFPTGKINYHIDLKADVYWDGGPNKGKTVNLDFSKNDTPLYLLDQRGIGSKNPAIGAKNTLLDGETYGYNYSNSYSAPMSNLSDLSQKTIESQSYRSVWDSGDWVVDKPTETANVISYNGSTENYIIGSTFPEYRSDGWTGSKIYGVNDKLFSSNSFIIKMANEYRMGGENNPEGYANNVYYRATVVLDSYVDDMGKTIPVNKSGSWATSERNNPDGSYSVQNTLMSSKNSQLGTPNIGWGTVSKGDASTILGTDVIYQASLGSNVVSYGGYDALYKWNPDAFELTKTYAAQSKAHIMSAGYYTVSLTRKSNDTTNQKVFFGVAKSADNSFAVLTQKSKGDYTWYESYDDAIKSGAISALKSEVYVPTGPIWTVAVQIKLHVKTTKIGSFNEKGTANIVATRYYPYSDKARTKEIDVHENATYKTPSMWSESGELITKQTPVGSTINFETLAILNAEVSSSIVANKPTYYNSETVNWTVKSSIVLPTTGAPDGFDGTVQTEQILPKGLDYKVGSGKQGSIAKEPKIVKNANGTTTLTWDLLVSKDTTIDNVTFATTINPFALTSGVQSSLTVKNMIISPLDTRKEHLRSSTLTINVLKVGMVGIYENINKQYGEKNSDFSITLQPYTTIEEEMDVKGITVLPQTGDALGSSFSGSALLKKITIMGGKPVTLYLNNTVIADVDPQKVDVTKNGWYKYTGAGQNISGAKTVLFHVEGVLANTDTVGVQLDIQTKDNHFGDVYLNETTINSATDYKLSPISNKVRYIIRADVELNLERIQIYTANAKLGLPVKVRINKEVIKDTALTESLTLAIYNKATNMKVVSKTYTVKDLLRENDLVIPASVLAKDQAKDYEVRVEGYNDNRVYVLEGTEKLDTKGHTASEKSLTATTNTAADSPKSLDYKGVIMTEREVGKERVDFFETVTVPIVKKDSYTTGYGVSLNQTVSYTNDLGTMAIDQDEMVELLDEAIVDGDSYTKTDGSIKVPLVSETIATGKTAVTTYNYPKVYINKETGDILSEQEYANGLGSIDSDDVVDGGNNIYVPIWLDSLGLYDATFKTVTPYGVNEINLTVNDKVDVGGYLFAHIDSETLLKDALLIQPGQSTDVDLFDGR